MSCVIALMQFAGVLLQTVPVAILTGWPFGEEEFRVRKKNYYIVGILMLVILAVIFVTVYTFKDCRIRGRIMGDCLMVMIICLYFFYFIYIVRTKFMKKLIVVGIGCSYAAAVYLMNSLFVLHRLGAVSFEHPYFRENLTGLILITVLTYPLMYWYMMKIVKPGLQIISDGMLGRQCVSVMLGLFLFCLESRVMLFGDFCYTISGVVAVVGSVVVMYDLFFNEVRLMQAHYELARQMDNFDMQSRSIGKNIEEMKRMHHNIRHHLNVIGILNHEGRRDEIAKYLGHYEKACKSLEKERLSGYMVLDIVLRYYLQKMQEEQIEVETNFQIGSSYDFEPLDITVLFGNCMENAIEEQRRLTAEERFVGIDIQTNGMFLLISMKNKCMSGIAMNGTYADWRQFPSSKRSGQMGEGLHSIDIIARKYKGSARFRRNESWFIMHVVLQIP